VSNGWNGHISNAISISSGVLGLAFTFSPTSDANSPQASQQISFAFTCFNGDSHAAVEEPGGVLTFGGTNASLFTGDIQFLRMPTPLHYGLWRLCLTSTLLSQWSHKLTLGELAYLIIEYTVIILHIYH
jgi:cathepsin D